MLRRRRRVGVGVVRRLVFGGVLWVGGGGVSVRIFL